MQPLNIITLKERFLSVLKEMKDHKINARYWSGITDSQIPKTNISRAHKKVVRYAKEAGLPFVVIAEDDIRFYAKGAYQYFLDNMPKDFDLYLGSYYTGIQEGNIVKGFRGLTLYVCSARFYDKFLSADESKHIDGALNTVGGKFVVCDKFCAYQEPGYSFQRKTMVNDNSRLNGKPKYGE